MYEAAASTAGGNETTMAKCLLLKLSGMARSWYLALALGSVYSWEQLRHQLHANFQGNETKEVTAAELYALIQSPRKSICDFQKCFASIQCQIRNITDESVYSAVRLAISNPALLAKLHRSPPSTTQNLYTIMRKYSLQEEGELQQQNKALAATRHFKSTQDAGQYDPHAHHRGIYQVQEDEGRTPALSK